MTGALHVPLPQSSGLQKSLPILAITLPLLVHMAVVLRRCCKYHVRAMMGFSRA